MRQRAPVFYLLSFLFAGALMAHGGLVFEVPFVSSPSADGLLLSGSDARRQILVTDVLDSGEKRDATRRVAYETKPSGIVRVVQGMVVPLRDGKTTLTARSTNGL